MTAALDAELDELAEAEAANPAATFLLDPPGLGLWGMAPWQRAVVEDPSVRVLVRGGNKVGKTTLLSWLCWAFLLGFLPGRPRPRGRSAVVLYIASDLDHSYADDVSRGLREFETPTALDPRCSYDPTRGYMTAGRRQLLLSGGDRVLFRSGQQVGLSLAGIWADLVVVNEPPRSRQWGEVMRAAALAGAPVVAGLTPLPEEGMPAHEDLAWLRRVVDPAEDGTPSGWSEHVVPLTPETVPHRTAESVAQQIRDMLPWERAQRRDAAWEGPAPDRMFEGFADAVVAEALGYEGAARVVLSFDHGERPGHEVCLMAYSWVVGGEVFLHVWDEYVSAGRTTEEQDAVFIAGMLGRHDLDLLNVDAAVGDVNSAGKSRAGESVNGALEHAFAGIAGLGRSPFRIVKPRKGAGSVLRNVRLTNVAMLGGRLKIHPRCRTLIRSVQIWRGRDDDAKHSVDGLLYLGSEVDPTRGRSGAGRISVT